MSDDVSNGWHNRVIHHNVLERFPLPDECVDVVITSPPYWGLRDYGVDGQIGLESHPKEYIDHLVKVASEVKRVLKKSGSFYLNLGDTYCGGHPGGSTHTGLTKTYDEKVIPQQTKGRPQGKLKGYKEKCLLMMPSRVCLALIDDGWILRNDIIWHKPNPMPSSVKDRLNNTFEHVFHFVKSKRYYYDLDKIREPHKSVSLQRVSQNLGNPILNTDRKRGHPNGADTLDPKQFLHKNGKNPGDFWDICTQPFTSFRDDMEHFAVFPEELVEKPLKASCPVGGVVLDPFGGRGTVGRVAKRLGFKWVIFDLNPKYCELARLYINGQKRKLCEYQQSLSWDET